MGYRFEFVHCLVQGLTCCLIGILIMVDDNAHTHTQLGSISSPIYPKQPGTLFSLLKSDSINIPHTPGAV